MVHAALLALALAHPHPYPPAPPPYPPYPPPGPPAAYAAPAPRGMVGLVLLPAGSSRLSSDETFGQDYAPNWHGAAALELRGPRGGGRLRFGFEASDHDRILDVSLKYDFFDQGPVQPFLTIGAGGARLGPETLWRATASISGGVDLFLTRDLFFTAELKGRLFSDLPATDPRSVYGSGVGMTTVHLGVGVYF